MPSTRTKARAGAKTARAVAQHPLLRTAVTQTAPPIARMGVSAGRKRLTRRSRRQLDQLSDTVGAMASLASSYAPQAAQLAQELGLVEAPQPKRTGPRLMAGVLLGAMAMFLFEPGHGREHRRQVQRLVGRS